MHEQHVVLDRALEWQVGRVGDVCAWREVIAGAEHEACLVLRHGKLGDRLETHATPAVVVPAPRRDAVEIADVLGLRKREESSPVQRDRILDEAADLEFPLVHRHLRLFAQIEHRPVLDFVLAHGQLRHAVAVGGPRSFEAESAEPDVDGGLVESIELDLPLDVLEPPLDQSRVFR